MRIRVLQVSSDGPQIPTSAFAAVAAAGGGGTEAHAPEGAAHNLQHGSGSFSSSLAGESGSTDTIQIQKEHRSLRDPAPRRSHLSPSGPTVRCLYAAAQAVLCWPIKQDIVS